MIPLSNVLNRGWYHTGDTTPPFMLGGNSYETTWAFICAQPTTKSETLRRYCRALYELGYVPVCPPVQDGQYLVLADPTDVPTTTRSCVRKFCGARFWCCVARKPTPPPTHKSVLPANTDASFPACTGCRRRPRGERRSPAEALPAGALPAGRFCKHSVWTSKRRFLGRAPNPRFKTIYERTW